MMEAENNNNVDNGITNEEKELIVKLRERVQDELPSAVKAYSDEDEDLFLVRWLRARDLDLDNATKMLRTSLQWRKERNADEAANAKPHPFFAENYPYFVPGTNKLGQPVVLIPLADWDFRKVVNNADRLAEFDDFVATFFEIICRYIREQHLKRKETGHGPITQMTMLVDVKSYSYMQLINLGAMKKILQIASTYETHYPEILFRAVFVNCPSYFGMFIAMLKPVIAPKTLGKLICYSQMSEWQKDMVELVDPTIIPEQYGGTKKE